MQYPDIILLEQRMAAALDSAEEKRTLWVWGLPFRGLGFRMQDGLSSLGLSGSGMDARASGVYMRLLAVNFLQSAVRTFKSRLQNCLVTHMNPELCSNSKELYVEPALQNPRHARPPS